MEAKKAALAAAAAVVVVGGVVSGVAFGASGTKHGHKGSLNFKATSTSTTTTGTFKSNEDPAHEAGESAAREAQENSGQWPGPGPGHGGAFKPNEDPAHEAGESAAREAQEDAGQAPTGP